MSTKTLTQILDDVAQGALPTMGEIEAARAELAAIEQAATAIASCSPAPFAANSERGRKWYPAMKVIYSIAKDAP